MDPPLEPNKQRAASPSRPLKGGYRVIVRVRPPNAGEENAPIVVSTPSDSRLRVLRSYQDPLDLSFDHVFGLEAEQADIFPAVSDVVSAVLNGHNSTILAYGQTGSGKTHTMTGGLNETAFSSGDRLLVSGEQRGIIPRTVEHLFDQTSTAPIDNSTATWRIFVNFMEIYNEHVYDLLTGPEECRTAKRNAALHDSHSSQKRSSVALGERCLDIWEDRDGSVSVPGITVVEVDSLEQVLEVLRLGTASRTYGDNGVNSTSSRSHAIFQVQLEKRNLQDGRLLQHAKLNLVDLAGSEKIQPVAHGAVPGVVLQELTSINLSLSTLGQCIAALVARNRHVPCRDSKLTRLLQDSLRGDSVTAMCICIAPTKATLEETLSSLQFADRAKRAVLQPPRKTVKGNSQAQVAQLMAQVEELTAELTRERSERLRLENYLKDKSSQEASATNSSCSAIGSPTKASACLELLNDASKFEFIGAESSEDEAPCFGESRSSKLCDTDGDKTSSGSVRKRRVWGTDEEGGPGSNIAQLLSASSVATLGGVGSSSSLEGPHAYPNSDANTSHEQLTDCGETDAESKLTSASALDSTTVDSIASIDSRLKMLTGMMTDQNEELKKRLDLIGSSVLPGAAGTRDSLQLPPAPTSGGATTTSAPDQAPSRGAAAMAAALAAKGRSDPGNRGNDTQLSRESSRRFRTESDDDHIAPEPLRQIIHDALSGSDAARQVLSDSDSARSGHIGSKAVQQAVTVPKQRGSSPPPAPPQVSGAQKMSASSKLTPRSSTTNGSGASTKSAPRQSQLDGHLRSASPPGRAGAARHSMIPAVTTGRKGASSPPRSKTPPPNTGGGLGSTSAMNVRRRTAGPATTLPVPPLHREAAKPKRSSSQNSSASACSSAAPKKLDSPRTRMSALFGGGKAASGSDVTAAVTSSSGNRSLASSPLGTSEPLASSSTWMALPPPPMREDNDDPGRSCAFDDEEDDASASCWGSLLPKPTKANEGENRQLPPTPTLGSSDIRSPFSAFADIGPGRPSKGGGEVPTTTGSLSSRTARSSEAGGPARTSKTPPRGSQTMPTKRSSTPGARGSQAPAGKPAPATPVASEPGSVEPHKSSSLIFDQDSVEECTLARSNSSTSIGDMSSMSSRRHAASDVSSSGFGSIPSSGRMGPGSDIAHFGIGAGGYAASHRRQTSAGTGSNSRAASNPGGNSSGVTSAKRRESALDIASRCWQEFEGALK